MEPHVVVALCDEVTKQMNWTYRYEGELVNPPFNRAETITCIANTLKKDCGIDNIRAVKYAMEAICSADHIQITTN